MNMDTHPCIQHWLKNWLDSQLRALKHKPDWNWFMNAIGHVRRRDYVTKDSLGLVHAELTFCSHQP